MGVSEPASALETGMVEECTMVMVSVSEPASALETIVQIGHPKPIQFLPFVSEPASALETNFT